MGEFRIWIGLFFMLSTFACTPSKPPMEPPTLKDGDPNCYHNGHQSAAKRRRIYPFGAASSVEVASFKGVYEYNLGKIAGEDETVVLPDTFERVLLSSRQIDAFTDVLFNYNYSKKTRYYTEDIAGCYFPRQVVLFRDDNGRIFESMEVCFECERVDATFSEQTHIQYCEGKYALLKAYFVGLGITYFRD